MRKRKDRRSRRHCRLGGGHDGGAAEGEMAAERGSWRASPWRSRPSRSIFPLPPFSRLFPLSRLAFISFWRERLFFILSPLLKRRARARPGAPLLGFGLFCTALTAQGLSFLKMQINKKMGDEGYNSTIAGEIIKKCLNVRR